MNTGTGADSEEEPVEEAEAGVRASCPAAGAGVVSAAGSCGYGCSGGRDSCCMRMHRCRSWLQDQMRFHSPDGQHPNSRDEAQLEGCTSLRAGDLQEFSVKRHTDATMHESASSSAGRANWN